ncbi:MAG: hypothetical protein CMO80_12380 [Verrucomicrobiales bacterium]|nr:hypothetical protein [Verrucomicrobiales bacterium]
MPLIDLPILTPNPHPPALLPSANIHLVENKNSSKSLSIAIVSAAAILSYGMISFGNSVEWAGKEIGDGPDRFGYEFSGWFGEVEFPSRIEVTLKESP